MSVRLLMSNEDFEKYEGWVRIHPQGSLWQSLEWKKYQESLGREVRIYVEESPRTMDHGPTNDQCTASALVVIDRTSFGLSTWEIPRGPLIQWTTDNGQWTTEIIRHICHEARNDHCLAVYLSPPHPLSTVHCLPLVALAKWGPLSTTSRHVMPEATRLIDLSKSEEEILSQMHPKGRYNINLAKKHGILVKKYEMSDKQNISQEALKTAYALIQETARRDGFTPLPRGYYEAFLHNLEGSFLLLAEEQSLSKPIAVLLGVIWKDTGIYYYGASSYEHRALMAPYVLQWEAMKYCKTKGCTTYDLFGITPPLPAGRGVGGEGHPWSGVSSFKSKFGGTVVTYPPEQQIVIRPAMHQLLKWKRRILG